MGEYAPDDGFYGDKQEPIAIVGASCRFPGSASSMGNLWDMISRSRSAFGKVPSDRFDADAWYHPDPDRKGTLNVKHGYFLKDDVTLWDAPFFGITAKEAAGMDPMKRLLLEVSYECFENAGIPIEDLMDTQTGCYVGCMTNDYELLSTRDINDFAHVAASGNSQAMIANRLSWYFGLRGPSLTLDTACSASLYALHLACQALRLGEIDMGLVTGVNLILYPNFMHRLTAMHMLSPEGISHTFDDRANGYGRGEGVGAVVVKRLKDALRDGDTIRAVIRGIGVNVDGKTPSITMPSSDAQADLIRRTYNAAGLSYADTAYFETHGTGTPVGDPIELAGIASTFGSQRGTSDDPLYIGSIKANVGHTEGCSGLAGVFKALLCLEQGTLVPTAGFENLNPKLKLSDWRLALPIENMKWPRPGVRRVSVNSFGFGGANGHVIMDDAYHYLKERRLSGKHSTVIHGDDNDSGIGTPTLASERRSRLFVFSAKDQAALQRMATGHASALAPRIVDDESVRHERNPVCAEDLAFTLAQRRSQHDFRSYGIADAIDSLCAELSKGLPKLKRSSKHNNIIFVFTGQGAQWPSMGSQLLRTPVFRDSIQQTQEYLNAFGCPWNLVEELERAIDSRIDQPEYSQPLCTAIQIAMVDMLRQWRIKPRATVGHSSGEIGAAYAADAISHRDAMKIAYFRGVCSGQVANLLGPGRKGAMLAAGLSEDEAQPYLEKIEKDSAVVACVNGPSSVTISGDADSVAKLEELISGDGKFARKLRVQTAYHSPHMQVVAQKYLESMGTIATKKSDDAAPTDVKMFSSVTGQLMNTAVLNEAYWVRNMCEQVKFSQALTNLLEHSVSAARGRRKTPINWSAVLEIGPHGALQGPVSQILKASTAKAAAELQYASMITRGQDAEVTALKAAGQLWSLGHSVDFLRINHHDDDITSLKNLTDLPAYPWNHSKGFWHESLTTRSIRFPSARRNDFLGIPVENQNTMEPRWLNHLRVSENPWIEHHCITGTILYPAAGMLIMVIEAARQMADSDKTLKGVTIQNVNFERGLVIPSGEQAVETSLSVQPHEALPSWYSFTVFSIPPGGSWTKHCFGIFSIVYEDVTSEVDSGNVDMADWQEHTNILQQIRSQSTLKVDTARLYQELETVGMEYGESFRNMAEVSAAVGLYRSYGTIKIPDTKSLMPYDFEYPHIIHPATLDAIFHLLFVAFANGSSMAESAVPYTLEHMYIAAKLPQGVGQEYIGYAQRTKQHGRETTGDIVISDASWAEPKIVVSNFAMRQVTSGSAGADMAALGENDAGHAPHRCVGVEWNEDVDFLRGARAERALKEHARQENMSKAVELHAWLERLCHKRADCKALFVVDDCEDDAMELSGILHSFGPRGDETRRLSRCTVATTSDAAVPHLQRLNISGTNGVQVDITSWDLKSETELPFEPDSFDLVVSLSGSRYYKAGQVSKMLSKIKSILSKQGHVIFAFQSHGKEEEATLQSEVDLALNAADLQPIVSLMSNGGSRLIIAEASSRSQPLANVKDLYLLDNPSSCAVVSTFKENLSALLSAHGIRVHAVSLSSVEHLRGQHVISLLEVDKPFVKDWNSTQFEQFKQLVSSAKHMMWITRGGQTLKPQDVGFAPTTGLLRVIRTEYPQITLPHLDLSRGADLATEDIAKLLVNVWFSSISETSSQHEMEFAELDGSLFIPRVFEEPSFDRELELHSGQARPIMAKLSGTRPLRLGGDIFGQPGDYIFLDDLEASNNLDPDEVEIRVEAVALNASDIESAAGTNVSTRLGREAVGVINRLGSSVSHFRLGQRVVMMKEDCCRTHLRQHKTFVAEVPASLPATTSVALPHVFSAAWYALVEVARLQKGKSVLIHNAAGGLGQAAIQIARFLGAEIFATVGTKEKKNLLASHYQIAEDHVFDSRSTTFVKGVLQSTLGRGVDVVLNSRRGQLISASCSCIAEFGCLVDLSRSMDGAQLASKLFRRNALLATVDVDKVLISRPEVMQTIFHMVFELAQMGLIGNISPVLTHSIGDLNEALSIMHSNKHSGKVVLTFDDEVSVRMLPPSPPPLELDPAGTYILAGGLGALGFDIAQTMFKHSARHIVFLSRSGGAKHEKQLEDCRRCGLKADAFKCDISNPSDVENVVQKLKQDGCQIKGLVQCAMVLEDSIFETMPFDKWQRVTQPKIQGTWNLHNLLPKDLDFFIMLSSVVCVIGNAAQANYAAGNTYEDAFAKYRRDQGLAASTINVGIVADSAHFIAENNIDSYIKKYGHLAGLLTTKNELDIALRAMMRGKTGDGSPIPAQLVLGMRASLSRDGLMADSWTKDRKFDHRVQDEAAGGSSDVEVTTKTALKQAGSVQEAFRAVENFLKDQVALAMGATVDEVDGEKPLYDFGVDSLKAVDLRNRIFRDVQAEVSVFEILSPIALSKLSMRIVGRSEAVSPEVAKQAAEELSEV